MRILEHLKKYESSLTVAQLIEKIEADMLAEKTNEEAKFKEIKQKFKNVYLKEIDNDTIFGKTLKIYHVERIASKERNTDWEFIYNIRGSELCFAKRDLYIVEYNGKGRDESFTEKELNEMEIISEEEYLTYLKQYNEITDKLLTIIE